MTKAPAVAVEDVTCVFKHVRALDGLSLTVPSGQVVGILGPNGAGKTTLIDVICGLVRPTSGRVTVLGQTLGVRPVAIRRQIGVLPQETALYEELTAVQNLRFAAALFGIRQPDARIAGLMELVGLTNRMADPVRTYSGGMQRRLAIARALLHDPPLLLLDEPTLGVDVEARHQIWAHIRGLRAQGRTVILTTNYLDEAEALCDRVVILRGGRVVADDAPASLVARTGRCLELDCTPEHARHLRAVLRGHAGALRTELADAGLLVYINGQIAPDDLLGQLLAEGPLQGFRVRSPDLVEVFKTLASKP